jgi:hypothetical protein
MARALAFTIIAGVTLVPSPDDKALALTYKACTSTSYQMDDCVAGAVPIGDSIVMSGYAHNADNAKNIITITLTLEKKTGNSWTGVWSETRSCGGIFSPVDSCSWGNTIPDCEPGQYRTRLVAKRSTGYVNDRYTKNSSTITILS